MLVNQNFVPSWNSIYPNLLNKVVKSIIHSNEYTSPFSKMVQNMEVGAFVEETHLNPSTCLLQDTVTNSDILTDYHDDIVSVFYDVNIDLAFPSSFTEYVVRESFNIIENVAELISALTANIRVTMEYYRNNQVKQMLYNAYHFGMLSSVTIPDPRLNAENSGKFVVTMNTLLDDFRTEMNPRNVIYNNQVGLDEKDKRITIGKEAPYVIIFNEYVRDSEFLTALRLGLVEKFRSGNSNMDWQDNIIALNLLDFPKSIPPINRSSVTGKNVRADNVNFFEMPYDKDGKPLFSNKPTGGKEICGFILEPSVLKLWTQVDIMTNFINSATLSQTNREIYRGIMRLGAFAKICAITCNSGK